MTTYMALPSGFEFVRILVPFAWDSAFPRSGYETPLLCRDVAGRRCRWHALGPDIKRKRSRGLNYRNFKAPRAISFRSDRAIKLAKFAFGRQIE